MGLAHVLGLDDGSERWLCPSCGRIVKIEVDDASAQDSTEGSDDDPACPNCGSRGMRRLALF